MERWGIRTGYSGLISNKLDSRLVENETRWKQWNFDGEKTVHSNYFRLTRRNKVPFSIQWKFKDHPSSRLPLFIASFKFDFTAVCHSPIIINHHILFQKKNCLITNLTWTNQIQALFSSWPMKSLNCDKQVSVIDENNSHVDQTEKMF